MAAVAFASVELRTLIRQRIGQLGAVALVVAALALLVALASYDPHDPSLNTATARAPANLLGLPGAIVADALMQYLGAVSGLVILAMLAWAWRLLHGRPLRPGIRVLCLVLALPVVAAVAAALPGPQGVPATWPAGAGPGGALGLLLAARTRAIGHEMLGLPGDMLALGLVGVLALLLTALALGLTAGEWRAAGQGAVGVARGGVRGGRGVANAVRGGGTRAARLFGRAAAPLHRVLEPDDAIDDPAAPPGARPPPSARRQPSAPTTAEPEAEHAAEPGAGAGKDAPITRRKPVPPEPRRADPRQQNLPLVENGWEFPSLSS